MNCAKKGTAAIYIVKPDDHEAFQCDFEIEAEGEIFPEQVRAYRKARRRAGMAIPRIQPHELKDEIVMLFGPEVPASTAVQYLERMAKHIRKKSLPIGRRPKGNFATKECLSGRASSNKEEEAGLYPACLLP